MGLDTWEHDLRYALRRLLRKPGFSLLVVLTLGLGFGANTAVFSVMHSVLLEPLPYEAPQELVRIYAVDRDARGDGGFLSAPSTLHIRDASTTLAGIAMLENYAAKGVDITEGDRPERARMLRVSSDYLDVLRISPVLGRTFRREEENDASKLAVISERIWERHLGGEPTAVGSPLNLDGVPHTVIGIVSNASV